MQNDAATPSFLTSLPVWVIDHFSAWPTLRIATTIPLNRIEWLWNSGGSSVRDSSTSTRASFHVSTDKNIGLPNPTEEEHDFYRNPYVYIWLIPVTKLDPDDLAPIWRQMREFVDGCREKFYEYLVILSATRNQLIKYRRSIDKLRSEVNLISRGRDRVVIVPPAKVDEQARPITHLNHSPTHQQLLLRVRECIRDSIETRIQQCEEVVLRSFLSRGNSSWNFPSFFALKEGLAFIFVQLGRRDLAVKFYEELTASMKDMGIGERPFSHQNPTEAARDVMNAERKDYRKFMIENSITELELKTYCTSRKIGFLIDDRRASEAAEASLNFITETVRQFDTESPTSTHITPVFRHTWTFVAARSFAAALAPSIPSQTEASKATSVELATSRERHTARLVAGLHVHVLKAFLFLSQITLPGCLSSAKEASDAPHDDAVVREARATADDRLRTALMDPKAAELLHSEIANAAASLYEMGSRPRGAAALDGDAGIIRLQNNSLPEAEALLREQCSRFSNDNGWDELHRKKRLFLSHAEKQLGNNQKYLLSCLTMLHMERESRKHHEPTPEGEPESDDEYPDAEHWVQEIMKMARELPKSMRYKADKLFDVSVLPNTKAWHEGDPGSAIVRIQSDICAVMKMDRVVMEVKLVRNRSTQNALEASRSWQSRDPNGSDDHSFPQKPYSIANIGSNNQGDGNGSNAEEDVVFVSSGEVLVRPGRNDVIVDAKEITACGWFKVMLVAMYMDKLKLSAAASKTTADPIAKTLRHTNSRSPKYKHSTTLPADVSNCAVPFPLFLASERNPAAFVCIESDLRFYLAPGTVQYVKMTISANENGIKSGAKVSVSLFPTQDKIRGKRNSIIQLVSVDTYPKLPRDVLKLKPFSEDSSIFTAGSVRLEREFQPHEKLEVQIGVRLSEKTWLFAEALSTRGLKVRKWAMNVEFACDELSGNTSRTFICRTSEPITLVSPISVTGRVELGCEWGSSCSEGKEKDSDSSCLREGGTLLCVIESSASKKDVIKLKRITLTAPPWLTMRTDSTALHDRMLPCSIVPGGSFSSVFDFFLKEGTANSTFHDIGGNTLQTASNQGNDESTEPEGTVSEHSTSDSSEEAARVEYEYLAKEGMDKFLRRKSSTSNEEDMEVGSLEDEPDAGNLRIELEISNVDGTTCLDRKVSLSALRSKSRRYRVDRHMERVGECGELMQFRFKVRPIGERRAVHEDNEDILHYELDADPTIWLLTGRRRSELAIGEQGTDGTALVMPLVCGNQLVPKLRLYTKEGDVMRFSRYANANEYMEVVILPAKSVLSRCSPTMKSTLGIGTASTKSKMPAVVPSDSFFGS